MGDELADEAAAEDRNIFDAVVGEAGQADHRGNEVGIADDEDPVLWQQRGVATGDQGLLFALDGDDAHGDVGKLPPQFGQRSVKQGGLVVEAHAEQDELALGKLD